MTSLGWLIAGLFCLAWLCAEYERRELKRLMRAYEQHMRNKLVPYDKILDDLKGIGTVQKNTITRMDETLNMLKARAIVKKSEAHKFNPPKSVD